MNLRSLSWVSFKGTERAENRDFCGIAITPSSSLFIVIDGATKGPNAKNLVRKLTRFIVDSFILINDEPTEIAIIGILKKAYGEMRYKFPADSASYIILLSSQNSIFKSFHLGDCRLGISASNLAIEWKTSIHSAANAVETNPPNIHCDPRRHLLTKSFRSRQFFSPDVTEIEFPSQNPLLLSTDGFWAELTPDIQTEYMEGKIDTGHSTKDDRSCLVIKKSNSFVLSCQPSDAENIYCRNLIY